jgi:hypothetical protein
MAKKFTLILVLFALSLGVIIVPATTTYAAESPSTEYYNAQYDFSYEETVMPTKQIVRKYEKPETSIFSTNSTVNSVTKTKAILASLGMGEDFIDALSNEQLNEYANSEFLMATEAFIKTDAEGNSTFVTESEAQEGSRAFVPPGASEDDLNDPGDIPSWSETSTDEYMLLVFFVSYRGDGVYHYSVDAEWLQIPQWFLTDSLGACMQNGTVINSSRTGWYSWKQYEEDDISTMFEVSQTLYGADPNSGSCAFENTTNGNWTGSAASFSYPPHNLTDLLHDIVVIDYKAHVEFDMVVSEPEEELYFNTVATYSHSTVTMGLNPSLSINLSGGVSIGLVSVGLISHNRDVEFSEPLHYIPE